MNKNNTGRRKSQGPYANRRRRFPEVEEFLEGYSAVVDAGKVPELKKAGVEGHLILRFGWDDDGIPDFEVFVGKRIGMVDGDLRFPEGTKGTMALMKWLNDMSDELIDEQELPQAILDNECSCDEDDEDCID